MITEAGLAGWKGKTVSYSYYIRSNARYKGKGAFVEHAAFLFLCY